LSVILPNYGRRTRAGKPAPRTSPLVALSQA
jgi:hypothetical protein